MNNESFSKMLEGDSKDLNTMEGSPIQHKEELKIEPVVADTTTVKTKPAAGAVVPPKVRSHEQFL